MPVKKPAPGDLEPIERASASELKALQLERLRWSLDHAYRNVPHYRKAFDAAGVKPSDVKSLADLARFPFTTKADLRDNYPFGMFAVPREQVVRIHASSGTTGKPTVVGYTARDIDTWATVMARSIRAAGGRPGDRVHVAYGYGLFTGGPRRPLRRREARLHGDSDVGRHDRAPGAAHLRLRARDHHGDAVVHAGDRRGDRAAGQGSARLSARGRHLRRRAVDAGDARGDRVEARHGCDRHLRALRGDRPGRRTGVHRDQGRPRDLGGPLLSRDRRPQDRRGAARGREGRARVHVAHQGSAARSCATARATSRACCRRRPARCAASRRSPDARTTC